MKISHKWFHIKQSNILQTSVPIKSSNCSLLEKLKDLKGNSGSLLNAFTCFLVRLQCCKLVD